MLASSQLLRRPVEVNLVELENHRAAYETRVMQDLPRFIHALDEFERMAKYQRVNTFEISRQGILLFAAAATLPINGPQATLVISAVALALGVGVDYFRSAKKFNVAQVARMRSSLEVKVRIADQCRVQMRRALEDVARGGDQRTLARAYDMFCKADGELEKLMVQINRVAG
jgi:hypothetical protein